MRYTNNTIKMSVFFSKTVVEGVNEFNQQRKTTKNMKKLCI